MKRLFWQTLPFLIGVISLLAFTLNASELRSDIVVKGEVSPEYDGSDPWNMGTSPLIGITGIGTIDISNGSEISSLGTRIGDQSGSNGTINILARIQYGTVPVG